MKRPKVSPSKINRYRNSTASKDKPDVFDVSAVRTFQSDSTKLQSKSGLSIPPIISTNSKYFDDESVANFSLEDTIKKAKKNNIRAQIQLALYYFIGSAQPDLSQAVYWFQRAADRGNPDAQVTLGWLYFAGEGVSKNLEHAKYWLRKAAEQDYINADFLLGHFYETGLGTETDYAQALYWYSQGARAGDANSQYHLSLLYRNGYKGVPKSPGDALMWLRKAAVQGHSDARKDYELIRKSSTAIPVFNNVLTNESIKFY
jgi:TPR repeat protein